MLDPDSRYANVEKATYTTATGREIHYVKRRFVPSASAAGTLSVVSVNDGDRIDLIAARGLGDPLQFWRICDANEAMQPADLTERPGTKLKIPSPV